MATKQRTTSTPRRASVAKPTIGAKDSICRIDDKVSWEVYGLGHLAELMELFGDHVSTPYAGWSNLDMQQIGLRVEYMGALVKRHAEAIGKALADIRAAAEGVYQGDAQ